MKPNARGKTSSKSGTRRGLAAAEIYPSHGCCRRGKAGSGRPLCQGFSGSMQRCGGHSASDYSVPFPAEPALVWRPQLGTHPHLSCHGNSLANSADIYKCNYPKAWRRPGIVCMVSSYTVTAWSPLSTPGLGSRSLRSGPGACGRPVVFPGRTRDPA